ncbi:uncharacterized protein Z518_10980 [Rhinocladiella mackenziei CBS 650.93]|uniref:Xylanolytic transcriptional activator regulatory domain-containing protein n=1 Tax=Rhinocladiella mackenziei CBS 650.93 TaxID=1442369 RepID=A0A0D2GP07_9EURO|nr:uncharacterized protein Z518_10980 [Rhinocladiella mackenziei CBS 650.93]KIX00053.1 hypothetical protein Z518_10980 [Rhinocladiella mackenziei CBS 650.93]
MWADDKRKPHGCQACGASFGRADVLHRHMKRCEERRLQASRARAESQAADAQRAARDQAEANVRAVLSTSRDLTTVDTVEIVPDRPNTFQSPPSQLHLNTPPASSTSTRTECHGEGELTLNPSFSVLPPHQGRPAPSPESSLLTHRQVPSDHAQSAGFFWNQPQAAFNGFGGPQATLSNQLDHLATNSASQRVPLVPSQPETVEDIANFNVSDFMFLEDSLLPDFEYDFTGLSPGPAAIQVPTQQQPPLVDEDILSSRTRHVTPTPSPNDAQEGRAAYHVSPRPFRVLRCSQGDVEAVEKALLEASHFEVRIPTHLPNRSRLARFLNAYFEYFDPHTPIVHRPSFSVSSAPPALILAMLAIGGCYLSEHDRACQSYEASCRLLAQYEIELLHQSEVELGPIQAALLCVQFGAFTDNPNHFRQAQRQLSLVSDLLKSAETGFPKSSAVAHADWNQWLCAETLSRLTCWAWILNAIIVVYDPTATSHFAHREPSELPLPSNDTLWRASSPGEWAANKETEAPSSLTIKNAVAMILRGQRPAEAVSSFGLLSLLGPILSYICGTERYSVLPSRSVDKDFVSRMEQSLRSWEILWHRHPHAETVPSRHGDPLMVDCLSLLGSAYYHLYMGPELRHLKQIAADPGTRFSAPKYKLQSQIMRAVKYAASSWLVRAKLGIAHLQRTAALSFGGHVLVTAYESALILSWWLSIRRDASFQFSGSGENLDGLRILDGLFQEIFEEIGDQGVCCDFQKVHPGSPPLDFYRMLMHRWVWTYSAVMEQNLKNLDSKLKTAQPNSVTSNLSRIMN